MSRRRFEVHTHTETSNIRLLDCTNKMDKLVDYAIELGLSGIAITDHECLSQSIDICKKINKIKETSPDFKIAIGNEIYLTETRERRQKYYHLILIAKDEIGHRQLRELSTIAWFNSYNWGKMIRVPTLKSELKRVIERNRGHIICTTACLGSELGIEVMNLNSGDETAHDRIVKYMLFLKDLFGEDFYVECAPNKFSEEQIEANKRYAAIAKAFDVKMVVGTDAHYLKETDKYVHEAFLKSKSGEREVGEFYKTTYLMSDEEVKEHLLLCYDEDFIDNMYKNSLEIYDKVSHYDLHKKQDILRPQVELRKDLILENNILDNYKTLEYLYNSSDEQEKFWVTECLYKLKELGKLNNTYLERLEWEADVIKYIGDDFGTVLFSYFNNLNRYIKYIWEVGSIVGPSRGSACCYLSNYLLDITQLDSVEEDLPAWRFLNKGNTGSVITTDIDIDVSPLARNAFISKMKKEVGEINCIAVGSFGTITTKSAIGVACRGYRSEEYPEGIDIDVSQYLSSLIPTERGFLWSLHDIIYGDEEKGRKPSALFLKEVNKYPRLLEIMVGIEGLIDKVTRHAAGIVIADDMLDYCSLMRTPSGELISCYSLYPLEDAGLIKYDILVTDASAKITAVIDLLKENNEIDSSLSLKEAYDTLLHPKVIDRNNKELWDKVNSNTVLDLFQFNTGVGAEAIKKIQPENVTELASANAAMRLVSEKGGEPPVDRFMRMKNNINEWYKELRKYNLSKEEIKIIEPLYLPYSGCIFLQESLMLVLMDKNISSFTLQEANKARKVVAKKQMKEIPWLKEKIYSSIENKNFANYIWDTAIKPQLSYAFSLPHCLGYGWIAMQEAYINLKYHPIYWKTACLNINAAAIDDVEYDEDYLDDLDIVAISTSDEEEETKKKVRSVKYGKIAKALGEMGQAGVKISPPLVNEANKDFVPDKVNNRILYSLKSLTGVGDEEIENIIKNRPYASLVDFIDRAHVKKPAVVSLIKAGAFDELESKDRIEIMKDYITIISEPKEVLNLRNFKSLMDKNLLTDELEYTQRLFNFSRYIKLKVFAYDDIKIILDDRAQTFLRDNYEELYNSVEIDEKGLVLINKKAWEKVYKKEMDVARKWIKINQVSLLEKFNKILFDEFWDKYATGNISKWEMDSMSYYYHEHELEKVNANKYGLSKFSDLPKNPVVESTFKTKNGKVIELYKIERIMGTCIDKNPTKGIFTLLTPDGVVLDIRLSTDHFAYYNRQISELNEDNVKKVKEKSWFTRGNKLIVVGIRRDDNFVAKKYKKTGGHRLYKINEVEENGDLIISTDRWGSEELPN